MPLITHSLRHSRGMISRNLLQISDWYDIRRLMQALVEKTPEEEGVDALWRRVARSAEPKLSDEEEARLVALLEAGPWPCGWATDPWTAPRVRAVKGISIFALRQEPRGEGTTGWSGSSPGGSEWTGAIQW